MKQTGETGVFVVHAMVKCDRCGVSGPGWLQIENPWTRRVAYWALCSAACQGKGAP